jgi:hypothetical protein
VQFLASDLITRARVLVDSDEVAVKRWISDSAWIAWLNTEIPEARRATLRAGLLQFEPSIQTFDAAVTASPWTVDDNPTTPIDVMVILGVTEETGDTRRVLSHDQPGGGWALLPRTTGRTGPAVSWSAYLISGSEGVRVYVDPAPSSGIYRVYTVQRPPRVTALTDEVSMTLGEDERVVLGLAKSACIREGMAPPSIDRAITQWESRLEMNAALATQRTGARVRNVDRDLRGWNRRGQDAPGSFSFDPTQWWWTS